MSNLYPFGHDSIVRLKSKRLGIHTGLVSGQGMALLQPFTPYVEAVGSWVHLCTIAPCGSLHWSITARQFVLAAAHEPHPAVFVGFCMVYFHASIAPSDGGLAC